MNKETEIKILEYFIENRYDFMNPENNRFMINSFSESKSTIQFIRVDNDDIMDIPFEQFFSNEGMKKEILRLKINMLCQ